ncbi:MAG TPA: Trp biosynthesis-associated membrane protein [Propionibacteriaceae bacterium]
MRPRALSFGGLVVGGGVAIVAASQPWWRAVGEGVSVEFSGTDATAGLSQALAVVVLAGTLLILALRARGRRLVGVLLGLAGAGIVVVGALRLRPSPEAVRTQVRAVSLIDQFALEGTGWPWIFAAAGVLVVLGAVTTALTAPRWPSRAGRFERAEVAPRPVAADDEPSDVWKAMDAGMDPTDDRSDPSTAPDVRESQTGDTMERISPTRDQARPTTTSPPSVE